MNPRIDQLVKTLFKKDTLDQCTLPELQEYANRHPYFGAAQLLLAKKLQTEKSESYHEQLQKTFLFFHNPLWVEQLLSENGKSDTGTVEKQAEERTIEKTAVEKEPESIGEPVPVTIRQEDPAPAVKKEEMLFEPFHTVDYFASQGIKLKLEEKPVDKFGKQLKSFTEWLKSMKKLPVSEVAAAVAPAAEKKVEEMAEISLKEREVITEAMAEVWEKQGNMAKAMDIYNKLSLLEPAKSAYFAAKIEALKKTN